MSSDGEDNEDFYDDEFEDDGFGQDEAPNSGESCLLSTSCAARTGRSVHSGLLLNTTELAGSF